MTHIFTVALLVMNSLDVLTNADQFCHQSAINQYTEHNFLRNIMLPVSRCRSVLSGHNTTRDTCRQLQRAEPCTVSADCTASNGWQPKHTTRDWEGGQMQTVQLYQLKLCNLCHTVRYRIVLHLSQYVIVDKSPV